MKIILLIITIMLFPCTVVVQAACLILPPTAGGQHLFEREGAGEEVNGAPAEAEDFAEGAEDGGCENAAGAQA